MNTIEADCAPVKASQSASVTAILVEVAVSIADKLPSDEENLLIDRETLATSIELILTGDLQAADVLSRMFFEFKEAIDGGLQGINRTSRTLLAAVELIYVHTDAHAAAVKLYLLSRAGELEFEDEPINLLSAAIARRTGAAHKGKRSS
jgi:hypothetical protein